MRLYNYTTIQERVNGSTYLEIVKESANNYTNINKCISNPSELYSLTKDMGLTKLPNEEVHLFGLNTKGEIIGHVLISKGAVNTTILSPPEIFKPLLLMNAPSFILTHNHPSGNTSPSKEDISITKTLYDCSKLLSISMLDHIIVSDIGYYSFKEDGSI